MACFEGDKMRGFIWLALAVLLFLPCFLFRRRAIERWVHRLICLPNYSHTPEDVLQQFVTGDDKIILQNWLATSLSHVENRKMRILR